MGKLDHLKIKRGPKAFAQFAKNFNEQVDLLGNIQGGPGIDVQVAHSPQRRHSAPQPVRPKYQPRGKILFTLRPSAINGIGISGGSGGGNSNVNVATVDVVGSTGALVGVLQGNAAAANTFPTLLRVGSVSTLKAEHTNLGLTAINNGVTVQILSTTGMKITNNGATNIIDAKLDDGFYVTNGANTLSIAHANIRRGMSIRTINICNGNSVMSMDILASAPY